MNSPLLSTMNSIRTFLFAAALTLLAVTLPARAETAQTAGSLDKAFNPNVTGGNGIIFATAVQPDGKIIIGGNFASVDNAPHTNLARLKADGSVDASFTASTDWDVNSVVVQADGMIVIGGAFNKVNGTRRAYLARVNATGILDDSFKPDPNGEIRCMAVQADGKIVLGGAFAGVGGFPHKNIARIEAGGKVDASFNPQTNETGVLSVAVQPDQMILLGGTFTMVNTTQINRIARLTDKGDVDPSFNPGAGANNFVYSLAVQADGMIVLGGAFGKFDGAPHERMARLKTDGSVDKDFNSAANGTVNTMAIQTGGKIVLGGAFSTVNGTPRNSVARLDANGILDGSFNPGSGANAPSRSVAVQANGKIVLSGRFTMFNSTTRNAIARLNNDAAIQTLTVPDSTQVQWNRSGTAPEVSQVTFEQSTDNGATWTLLPGRATRIIGATGSWELTGLTLPPNVGIRAQGRTVGGTFSSSLGLIEEVSPLEKLKEGNARYASEKMLHPDQSAEKRKEVAKGQHPFAVIVGCADSRVPPEIVFDQGLGDLFVIRIAGEVVDNSALGSIEYAVEHLHAGLIVVLGHERCGAVAAAVEAVEHGTEFDEHIKTLVDAIKPAVEHVKDKPGDILENSVKENATQVAHKLTESEPVLKEAVEAGTVGIVTGYYNLETGVVTFYK